MQNIFNKMYLGNTVWDYLVFLSILLTGLILVKILKFFVLKKFKEYAQKTSTTFDDFLIDVFSKALLPLLCFGVFYVGINTLVSAEQFKNIINISGLIVLTLSITRFATMFIGYGFTIYLKKRGKDAALERSFKSILKIIKFIVWALAVVFLLDNVGFKISTVIAGLGIGGIAVGLASQALLKDLFSYFSIIFDRPFEIGDFIIVGEFLGTVEYIGAKTTRIRSLGGEQVIFSNTDLTDSRLRNYKRMEKRRVVFQFGVIYKTQYNQLKEIPVLVKNIVAKVKDTVFDRAHFFSYGDSSLIFEVVYYVFSSDYNKYMDIQQEINLALFDEFAKKGIDFAYPTQTLYLNKIE